MYLEQRQNLQEEPGEVETITLPTRFPFLDEITAIALQHILESQLKEVAKSSFSPVALYKQRQRTKLLETQHDELLVDLADRRYNRILNVISQEKRKRLELFRDIQMLQFLAEFQATKNLIPDEEVIISISFYSFLEYFIKQTLEEPVSLEEESGKVRLFAKLQPQKQLMIMGTLQHKIGKIRRASEKSKK